MGAGGTQMVAAKVSESGNGFCGCFEKGDRTHQSYVPKSLVAKVFDRLSKVLAQGTEEWGQQ